MGIFMALLDYETTRSTRIIYGPNKTKRAPMVSKLPSYG